MSFLNGFVVPADVREVIDRTDARMEDMVKRLCVIGDLICEQNSILLRQNELLKRMK